MNYKLRKCLFAINELWKHEHFCLYYMNYEKYLFAIHEFGKHESVCMQYMNYEKRKISFCNTLWTFCLQNMNYEDMKIFVCNTWIMKIICWHYINYEKN